jgi:hypothetical protein
MRECAGSQWVVVVVTRMSLHGLSFVTAIEGEGGRQKVAMFFFFFFFFDL